MAVAFDASSENVVTADPQEHTHTPVGTPRAAIVLICSAAGAGADVVTAVTYGGAAMARITTAVDVAGGETGRTYLYFLGSSIPTGAQTISVDRTEALLGVSVVGVTLTADADTEVVDSDVVQEDAANPSVTLSYGGRTCIAVGALYSGAGVVGDVAPNGTMSAMQSHDFGSFICRMDRQTTPGTDDFAFGYTALIDDVALVAAAISEVVAAPAAGTQSTGVRAMQYMYQLRSKRQRGKRSY